MEENNRIIPAEISKEMKDSYIDYAMSVIIPEPCRMCVTD